MPVRVRVVTIPGRVTSVCSSPVEPLTLRWPDDPRWHALLGPVAPVLERALARLSPAPSVLPPLVEGDTGGPLVDVRPDGVALDPALLAGAHPLDAARGEASDEARLVALDRWRRAAAAVLEGMALAALPEEPGAPGWWRRARAVEAADRAAPELGVLWPELVDWFEAPERGAADGRRAAWLARWARGRAGGADPAWAAPTPETWRAFGRWLFDPAGASVGAPVLLAPTTAGPGAWEAAPLSFRRVRVEAGPAGGRLDVTGAAAEPVALAAGERATVLLASVSGGPASAALAPAGPVGAWTLRSGRTDQRFGAARGIDLVLRPDGTGEVTLADAFIGPATEDALSLAERFGVSGTIVGRWRMVGTDGDTATIELGDVRPVGVTVHPRGRFGFAIPAGPILGRAEGWLSRVGGTRWRVRPIEDGGVEAEGRDLGPTVVLRFAKG